MIDLHSHILPGIDDGSRSKEESLAIIKKLHSFGVDEIFLTPHYIENSNFSSPKKENEKIFEDLKQASKDIDIKLHLANEIYIGKNITKNLASHQISPISNHFILVELPLYGKVQHLDDQIHEIIVAGFIPIIAHPERYEFLQNNKKSINELKSQNVLFQCNYGSLVGNYGRKAQKTIKYMLKMGLVDFMGTDVHRENSKILKNLEKSLKILKRLTKNDYFTYLTEAKALTQIDNNTN